jgi:predicted metal-dependent peptidase
MSHIVTINQQKKDNQSIKQSIDYSVNQLINQLISLEAPLAENSCQVPMLHCPFGSLD